MDGTREQLLRENKELKVSVPKDIQIALHAWKVLTGDTISETVERAIRVYLGERMDGFDASGGLFGDTDVEDDDPDDPGPAHGADDSA